MVPDAHSIPAVVTGRPFGQGARDWERMILTGCWSFSGFTHVIGRNVRAGPDGAGVAGDLASSSTQVN